MSREQIFEKLTDVFRDVFDDETLIIYDATNAEDIEDWDSLSHITLVSTVEDEFGIRFDMKAVTGLKNVGEMADLIEKLLE